MQKFTKDKRYVCCETTTAAGEVLRKTTSARFVEYNPERDGLPNLFFVDERDGFSGNGKVPARYISFDDVGVHDSRCWIEEAPSYTNWYKKPDEAFYRVYPHASAEKALFNQPGPHCVATAVPLVIPSK